MEPEVLTEKVVRMEKTLYGNGREGVVEKIQRVETLLKGALLLLGPICLAAVGFLGQLIVDFVANHT